MPDPAAEGAVSVDFFHHVWHRFENAVVRDLICLVDEAMAAMPRVCVRFTAKPICCHELTEPHCSNEAKPKPLLLSTLGTRETSSASMVSLMSTARSSCLTITSHPSRWVSADRSELQAAEKSVTACWQNDRLRLFYLIQKISRTPFASSATSWRAMVHPRWPAFAVAVWD